MYLSFSKGKRPSLISCQLIFWQPTLWRFLREACIQNLKTAQIRTLFRTKLIVIITVIGSGTNSLGITGCWFSFQRIVNEKIRHKYEKVFLWLFWSVWWWSEQKTYCIQRRTKFQLENAVTKEGRNVWRSLRDDIFDVLFSLGFISKSETSQNRTLFRIRWKPAMKVYSLEHKRRGFLNLP